jgi:PAS domain S-box-containing protein
MIDNGKTREELVLEIQELKQNYFSLQKQAEKWLQQIIGNNPMSIQILDMEGYTIQTNSAHFNLFGAVVPERYSLFKDPQLVQQGFGELFDRIKNGEVISFPDSFFNPYDVDPSFPDVPVTVKATGFPINDSNGIPEKIVVMQENITERRAAENEIKKKSAILDNLIINLQEGVLLEDSNRKILLTNQLFCDMFSIPAPPEALTGADCSESAEQNKQFFKNPEKFVADINLILACKKAIYNDELELLDGRYFERDYIPTWHNEVYSGHLWKYRDITERKQAQQKLQASEERYHSIFQGSPDGILIADAETKMITFSNAAQCRAFGYTAEEFKTMSITAIHPPDTLAHTLSEFESMLHGEKALAENVQCLKSNGEIFYADISGALISLNGRTQLLGFFRDITERKNAEKALKASEEKYRKDLIFLQSILESPITIVIFSIDKNYCYKRFTVSHKETMKKIWGVDIQIGMNMIDLITNLEDREKAKNNFDRALKGDFFILTEEYGDKELSRTYYDNYYSPVNDSEGNIVGISVFVLDVTQRKQAEREIIELNTNLELTVNKRTAQYQEALGRLEKIADRVPGVVYQFQMNPDGSSCFPFASKGIHDIYRVTPEEVAEDASIVFTRLHPDDFDGVVSSIEASAKENTLWQHEYRVKFDDGTVRWLSGNAKPQAQSDGTIIWYGYISDITQRKQIEEELKESTERHRGLSEAAFDSIFFSEKGLCIEQNQMAEKIFGYSNEEAIGRYGTEWIVEADRKMVMDNMIAGYGEPYEVTALRKDGTTFPCMLSGRMMYYKGRNVRVTSLSDITQRKQAEEALIEARNEEVRANQAKSEFLSRMSHELRTPMNSILGFAQLLEMGELKASHKKHLNHILNSGKHLLNLINEVLDISGIEAGRISLSFVPVELGRIIGETIDTLHPSASVRRVKLELINGGTDRLFVNADYHRLRQVLLNLINNGVKYNREGGSVRIKTELKQAISPENAFVRISVSDTGFGINPEFIGKIFMPFERIGAEKTGIEGTGLGLLVVKKLIDAMGGHAGVESVPGEGSTFWIELPHIEDQVIGTEQTELRSEMEEKIAGKTGTILYIEDNASNTELVEHILLNLRSTIHLVSSTKGAKAVSLANEYAPDLILLDLDLPDIQGFEVIGLLQAEEKTKGIPVVIISADAMPQQIERLMKAGSKDYLTKPLDIRAFLQVVDEWVGSRKRSNTPIS